MPVPFGVESNLLRNQFTGPGINNWDVALSKITIIKERFTFQLRFEFYNLFNRTQFTKPDTNIQDALFGYSTSQVGQNDGTTGARQVQIGAKFNFCQRGIRLEFRRWRVERHRSTAPMALFRLSQPLR